MDIFHVLDEFLKYADPSDKYKSDYSCLGFYNNLKRLYKDTEASIKLYYIQIHQQERQAFKEAVLLYIDKFTSQYIAGIEGAEEYLKNGMTIEKMFEEVIYSEELPGNYSPKYFRLTYKEIDKLPTTTFNDLNIHSSFIFYISNHFVLKLIDIITTIKIIDIKSTVTNVDSSNSIIELDTKKEKRHLKKKRNYTLKYKAFKLPNVTQKYEKIKDVFSKLEVGGFIDENKVELNDFYNIFNNTSPKSPIVWETDIQDLSCFVKMLKKHELLGYKMGFWFMSSEIFCGPNNYKYTPDNLRKAHKSKKSREIESIVKKLI